MKKCPRCDSISADADSSCGVCGGSLSGVTSERLERLVQKKTGLRPKKKSNFGLLALGIFALATTVAGAALLFFNGIGIILLLVGLSAILVVIGAAGGSAEARNWMAKKDGKRRGVRKQLGAVQTDRRTERVRKTKRLCSIRLLGSNI